MKFLIFSFLYYLWVFKFLFKKKKKKKIYYNIFSAKYDCNLKIC